RSRRQAAPAEGVRQWARPKSEGADQVSFRAPQAPLNSADTASPDVREETARAAQETGFAVSATAGPFPSMGVALSGGAINSETVYAAATIQAAINVTGNPHSRSFCIFVPSLRGSWSTERANAGMGAERPESHFRRRNTVALQRRHAGLADQLLKMRGDAPAKHVEIVPAFQQRDDPPTGASLGDPPEMGGDPGVVRLDEAQECHAVVAVRVEA